MTPTPRPVPALLDVQGAVATLVLNDPVRLNPLTEDFFWACLDALAAARSNKAIRVLVVRANGKVFSAGADLLDLDPAAQRPGAQETVGAQVDRLLRDFGHRWVRELRALEIPVVAQVHGAVAGGGVGFVLAADLVIAARTSYFYLPFAPALGLVPDMGAAWSMSRRIGEQRALAVALLGDKVAAEDAERWGLIYRCVDDARLTDEVASLSARLAALPAHSIGEMRRLMDRSRDSSLADFLAYERDRQRALADGPCFAEGVAAFRQRRAPEFPGRA